VKSNKTHLILVKTFFDKNKVIFIVFADKNKIKNENLGIYDTEMRQIANALQFFLKIAS